MGKTIARAMAALCLAGGLAGPSRASADPGPPDGGGPAVGDLAVSETCLTEARRAEVYPFQVETVRPDRIPGLPLSFGEADGWAGPVVNEYGILRQDWHVDKGSFASAFFVVYTAKSPRTLRDALDFDHRLAQSRPQGAAPSGTVVAVADESEDYRGRPSWFVRTRTEIPSEADGLCSVDESTSRDVLVEHGGKAYLVRVWGYYSWNRALSDADGPDDAVADEVADRVANGLEVEAAQ